MAAAPAPGGGGAAAACAACKYQRRRCPVDCPLAHYFPQDRPRVFRNAHRLFGVSNILKTLKRAGPDPGRRHEAMQCVVYESQAWDLYPSAGCVPIIHALQHRIQETERELRRVHAHLQACYRRRAAAEGGGAPDSNLEGGAKQAMSLSSSSSSSSPPAPPPLFQLQWTTTAKGDDAMGAAAAPAPFMYAGGGDDEQQQQMMAMMMISSADGGNIAAVAPPPPWAIQPPHYEHPFFVNATTMVPPPQFHYQHQQQPFGVSNSNTQPQLPELQDDMMNYFADDAAINGENDKMPRESSTDSSDEKAMKKST